MYFDIHLEFNWRKKGKFFGNDEYRRRVLTVNQYIVYD